MSINRDVPPEWADLLESAGLVDTRPGKRSGVPTMRRLAEAAATTTSTISAMMYGTRTTSTEVVERVADALVEGSKTRTPAALRERVHNLVGRAVQRPFVAHPDADLLDAQEQAAINELIRLWAISKRDSQPQVVTLRAAEDPDPDEPDAGDDE